MGSLLTVRASPFLDRGVRYGMVWYGGKGCGWYRISWPPQNFERNPFGLRCSAAPGWLNSIFLLGVGPQRRLLI